MKNKSFILTILLVLVSLIAFSQDKTKIPLKQIQGWPVAVTGVEIGRLDNIQDTVQKQLDAKLDKDSLVSYTNYFYTKQQTEALKNSNTLLEALQRIGTVVKGVPIGVGINSISNGTSALTDGSCYYLMFDVADTVVWTGIDFILNVAGNYTGDNYNGFALHSVTAAGVITKITETANDANIFKTTAYTLGTKAFPSPQTVLPGTYMISTHWNASATTTAPTIYTWGTITSNMGLLMLNGNKIAGYLTSQSTTPANTTGTALTVSSVMPFIFPY